MIVSGLFLAIAHKKLPVLPYISGSMLLSLLSILLNPVKTLAQSLDTFSLVIFHALSIAALSDRYKLA